MAEKSSFRGLRYTAEAAITRQMKNDSRRHFHARWGEFCATPDSEPGMCRADALAYRDFKSRPFDIARSLREPIECQTADASRAKSTEFSLQPDGGHPCNAERLAVNHRQRNQGRLVRQIRQGQQDRPKASSPSSLCSSLKTARLVDRCVPASW